MFGRARAAELWRRHNISVPVDLRRLVGELGLVVVTFPLRGRVKEVIIDKVIGVQPGLSRPWFRWYVAHAIGHHMMHVGGTFGLEPWQWISRAKSERQAEEFAGWLLCGPGGPELSASDLVIPWEKSVKARELVPPATQQSGGPRC